jgi:hypothetical protein
MDTILLVILSLVVIFVFIFLLFMFGLHPKGPTPGPRPGPDCINSTPCTTSEGKCVGVCVGDDELNQCPDAEDTCAKCPPGTTISTDRSTCITPEICESPNKVCDGKCLKPSELCQSTGECPSVDCRPSANEVWKAFLELLKSLFSVQGVETLIEFKAFEMAKDAIKNGLKQLAASGEFNTSGFSDAFKSKFHANVSPKVIEHLEKTNPVYKFRKYMKNFGKYFDRNLKWPIALRKTLKEIPETEGLTDDEIEKLITQLTDDEVKAVLERIEQNIAEVSLKTAAKELALRAGRTAAGLLEAGLNPAMGFLDVLMVVGMVEDALKLGGWTKVFNTDMIQQVMNKTNQDFVDACILSTGVFPVIVGPLDYLAMQEEAGELEDQDSLHNALMYELSMDFPFDADGNFSPLAVFLSWKLYSVWTLDQGLSNDEIADQFTDLMKTIPLDEYAVYFEEARKSLCIKRDGVYFDPFGGMYDNLPPPWSMACSFKDAATTEEKNGWFPGKNAKYSNFEWRSKEYLQNIPLMFENQTLPITLQFPTEITGASILVDDSAHRFCNTGQTVDFPLGAYIGQFTTYQTYDATTGVCSNQAHQCDLWGLDKKTITLFNKPYTNCLPYHGAGANIARFFIGDSLLQQARSSAFGANAQANEDNCRDLLENGYIPTPDELQKHYSPPN